MVVDNFQKGSSQTQTLVRWQYNELWEKYFLLLVFLTSLSFIFQYRCIPHYLVIHVAYKVVPVGIIRVNKTSTIDIELKDGLKPSIYFFEVVAITFYFHYFKGFGDRLRGLIVSLFFILQKAHVWSGDRHIALEASNLLSWQLKIFYLLLLKNFYELTSVRNKNFFAKSNFQDVSYVIILLPIVTAAPVQVGS